MRSTTALRPECADSPLLIDAAGAGRTMTCRHILRPYATAGVAIVGTGLIAVSPVAASQPDIQVMRDVGLTADGSPLGNLLDPWLQIFNTASTNSSTIVDNFSLTQGVAWGQLVANLSNYAQLILDDPSNITQVTEDLREDYKAVMSAITLTDADQDTVNSVITQTMDGNSLSGHQLMFGQIGGYLPPDQVDMITPIVNFLGSPMSAIWMGVIGPWVAPWVAMLNSISDGDSFSQIMASPLDGWLNGATLNLDSLLPVINGFGVFPPPMEMTHLDIAFGGMLSPGGQVTAAPLNVVDDAGNEAGQVPAIGGSIFNSVGLTFTGVPSVDTLQLDSHAVGPLGAWMELNQVIARQLGWGSNWDAKSGGPDVPAMPPGTGITFPTVPDDFFGDFVSDDGGAGGAAATDFADMLQDFFTGLGS